MSATSIRSTMPSPSPLLINDATLRVTSMYAAMPLAFHESKIQRSIVSGLPLAAVLCLSKNPGPIQHEHVSQTRQTIECTGIPHDNGTALQVTDILKDRDKLRLVCVLITVKDV